MEPQQEAMKAQQEAIKRQQEAMNAQMAMMMTMMQRVYPTFGTPSEASKQMEPFQGWNFYPPHFSPRIINSPQIHTRHQAPSPQAPVEEEGIDANGNGHRKERKKKYETRGTPNKRWDKEMDAVLIPFLSEQARKGLKGRQTFKKCAFVAAAGHINSLFGTDFTYENVDNHYGYVKKKFQDAMKARELSGVGWNDDLKMVTMDQEAYKSFITEHKHLKNCINRPIEFYEDMKIICGEDSSPGGVGFRSLFCKTEPFPGIEAADLDVDEENTNSPLVDEPPIMDPQPPIPNSPIPATSSSSKRSTRKRLRADRERARNDEIVESIYSGMKDIAASIKEASRAHEHWTCQLGRAVMDLEGFDEDSLTRALDALLGSEALARSFIVRPPKQQEKWINEFLKQSEEGRVKSTINNGGSEGSGYNGLEF